MTTNIAKISHPKRGDIAGEHYRYIKGHAAKKSLRYEIQDCGFITPCWIWQLYCCPDGYGYESVNRSPVAAHRTYYERFKGLIPLGLEIDHLCFQPSCVNPDHLETVTQAENIRRRDERSRRRT